MEGVPVPILMDPLVFATAPLPYQFLLRDRGWIVYLYAQVSSFPLFLSAPPSVSAIIQEQAASGPRVAPTVRVSMVTFTGDQQLQLQSAGQLQQL